MFRQSKHRSKLVKSICSPKVETDFRVSRWSMPIYLISSQLFVRFWRNLTGCYSLQVEISSCHQNSLHSKPAEFLQLRTFTCISQVTKQLCCLSLMLRIKYFYQKCVRTHGTEHKVKKYASLSIFGLAVY